jgi:hypothetical protein
MMLLVAVVDGFGLVEWGEPQAGIIHRIHKFTIGHVMIYETAHSLLTLLAIVICGILIKILGETFNRRYTYKQTFTLVIYGLSPMFLLRLLDAVPTIIPWATWALASRFPLWFFTRASGTSCSPPRPTLLHCIS